jgi:hypothetical protein
VDATTIPEAWEKAGFIRQTQAGFIRQTQAGRREARPSSPDA